jgi:Clp amino terminal domain, pathogenicity island component
VIDRLTDDARRVLDLAEEEASGFGHRYVGPEHIVLGVLRDGSSAAAGLLRARGLGVELARTALGHLAERGVVAGPALSDAELLGMLGIDLEAVRQRTQGTFGSQAVAQATREATRARRRGVGRVAWTPLCGPPFLAKRAVGLAHRQAGALGSARIGPELLLLGVLDDISEPWPRCMSNRWRRSLLAYVGLPKQYRGAASPLLEAFGVDLEDLRDALVAQVRGAER